MGTVDGKRGEFRKVAAFSQALGYYLAPEKIGGAVSAYCAAQNADIESTSFRGAIDQLKGAFEAQARLIIIHP